MAPTLEAIQDLKYVLSMVILDILAVLSVIFRFWAISIKGTKIRSHDIICIVSLVGLTCSLNFCVEMSAHIRLCCR